ncbi:MAG: class I SAM-dependent rRNA methyltransferase [Dongiaceae bacterium]
MNDADIAQPVAHLIRPAIKLKPGEHKRVLSGHPWIYSNEIAMDPAAKALPPGGIVRVLAHDGRAIGAAMFNPRPLIAARMMSRDVDAAIGREHLGDRLARALSLRSRLFPAPYYRLIHGEADGLPGAVIDRFGGALSVQVNTAGIERLLPELLAAIDDVLNPHTLVLRNDSPARSLEGLESYVRPAKGALEGPVELAENGVRFLADLATGQKTGWFFDQRENRQAIAQLAHGTRLLDLYCHTGGFGIQAAAAGAAAVLAVDRSESSLALAARSAELNMVAGRCEFRRGDGFETLESLGAHQERFDIVVADPPAFVKAKKDLGQAARAYRKLARLSAALVAPGGFLFIASCSHHMTVENFGEQVARGLSDGERTGRILRAAGAGPDHPVHPALPESAYLKALLLQID